MTHDFHVPLPAGQTTSARHYLRDAGGAAGRAGTVLVFAHGAGAGQHHPFMVGVAEGLAARGVDVVTFNFSYAEQRRRVPDRPPALEQCFRAVIETVRADESLRGRRIFIGGKSMGGRIATHLAAQGCDAVDGVVVLGYPLHPPGKAQQMRMAHLPSITCPVLVVQGERDAFGTSAELHSAIETMHAPVRLHIVSGGDHSLAVRGRSRQEVLDSVLPLVVDWMTHAHAENQ